MTDGPTPRWMTAVLAAAAAYNVTWATWAGLFPGASFAASGLARPDVPLHYPQVWQGLAALVGVFGLGYALAATDPRRHWGVVAVGLVSKVIGAAGTAYAYAVGTAGPNAVLWAVPNDLIWLVPFAGIVRHGARPSPRHPRTADDR